MWSVDRSTHGTTLGGGPGRQQWSSASYPQCTGASRHQDSELTTANNTSGSNTQLPVTTSQDGKMTCEIVQTTSDLQTTDLIHLLVMEMTKHLRCPLEITVSVTVSHSPGLTSDHFHLTNIPHHSSS